MELTKTKIKLNWFVLLKAKNLHNDAGKLLIVDNQIF